MEAKQLFIEKENYEIKTYITEDNLNIYLNNLRDESHRYQITLTNKNLPSEVKNHLENIKVLFQCLKSESTHEIIQNEGEIMFKTSFPFGDALIQKKSYLKLNKIQGQTDPYLTQEVNSLRKEIENLKNENIEMKQTMQNERDENRKKIQSLERQSESQKEQIERFIEILQIFKDKVDNVEKKQKSQHQFVWTHSRMLQKDFQMVGNKVEIMEQKLTCIMDNLETPKGSQEMNMERMIEREREVSNRRRELPLREEIMIRREQFLREEPVQVPRPVIRRDRPEEVNPIFDMKAAYSKKFLIDGRKVVYRGEDMRLTQLLLTEKVVQKARVSWKVLKTKQSYITMGVVDKNKSDARSSFDSGSAVSLNGCSGTLWYDKRKYQVLGGKKFFQSQIITVEVDRTQGQVRWLAGEQVRATIKSNLLKEAARVFVPFVEMYDKEDCIELV